MEVLISRCQGQAPLHRAGGNPHVILRDGQAIRRGLRTDSAEALGCLIVHGNDGHASKKGFDLREVLVRACGAVRPGIQLSQRRNRPASASSRAVASPPCRKCRITALLSSIRRSLLITVDSISGFAHGAFKVCALVSGHAARRCQQRRTFPLRACWRRVQVVDEFRHLHQLWRGQVAQVLARSASSGIDPPAPV